MFRDCFECSTSFLPGTGNMTIEKTLVHIEAMLCEQLQLAREDKGESTFSAEPLEPAKKGRARSLMLTSY